MSTMGLVAWLEWLAVAAAWAAGAPAFRGPRPIDTRWPQDQSVRIEWQADWEQTYKANMARWEAEIAKQTPDRGRQDARLRLRRLRLLRALIARYPGDVARRVEARSTMADDLVRLGFRGRGNYVLKELIDESPGRPDVAAAACRRILDVTPWDRPHETAEGREWVEYAASRLLGLERAGALPAAHAAVRLAQRAMVVARRDEGRFMEAAVLLAGIDGGEPSYWRSLTEADLLAAVGHGEEALHRYTELYRQSEKSEVKSRIGHLASSVFEARPTFPGRLGLEVRWEMLRDVHVAEAATRLAGLIAADAEGSSLVPWGEGRHTSLWAGVDRHLAGKPEAARLLLRTVGERDAGRALRSARGSGDADALLRVYRRFPWSAAGAEAALEHGERALRRGHGGLAARSFRDVATHAADAGVRTRARVGLWLALAPRRAALEAAFEGVDPEAKFPWMGKATPARAIRERLLGGEDAAPPEAPMLAALARRTVRMPPAAPWPREAFDPDAPKEILTAVSDLSADLQLDGAHALVCGPNVLCAYRDDLARPLWSRTSALLHGLQGREWRNDAGTLTVPGAFRPAVAGGRLYTRWGLDASRRLLRSVAAFDVASGAMAWSTAGDPAWHDPWPIGDPVVADGRVYVLTAPASHARVLPVVSVHLACLDADDGGMLWAQKLATHTFTLIASRDSPFYQRHFDVVHYGNAVAVSDGAVYCSSNLGFVARCDARDGVVEWARSYPRARLGHNALRLARRQGSAPLVVGGAVVFLPRDCPGAFAVDRESGEPRWDSPLAASSYAIGVAGQAVLLGDDRHVVALDAATGRPLWHRRFGEGISGRPVLAGSTLYVGDAATLYRVAAATGETLETAPWGPQGAMRAFALRGRVVVGLAERAAGAQRRAAGTPLNPQAPSGPQPLRLPVKRTWSLLRPNPRLIVPPPEAQLAGRAFLLSEDALECVAVTARGAVVWRRLLALGFKALAWAPKTLIFLYPRRAVAVDAETGTRRWEREVAFPIRRWLVAGPYLVVRAYGHDHRSRRTAAIEIASGKLLWDRSFRSLSYGNTWEDHLPYVSWDGRSVHLVGTLTREEKGCHDVVCRPTDGRIEAFRRVLRRERGLPEALVLEGAGGFYLSGERAVHEFSLGGGEPRRYRANLRDLSTRHLRRFELVGPWLRLVEREDDGKHTVWILRRGDPNYELRRTRLGTIRGNRLYEPAGDERLVAVDLPSRREGRTFAVPPTRGLFNRILDFFEVGNTLLVVSGLDTGEAWRRTAARLRVDTFERSSGKHLAGQVLRDVAYWQFVVTRSWRDHPTYETQVAWHEGVLLASDLHGLHAFAATRPDDPALEERVHVAYRSSRPVEVDGVLDEWAGEPSVALKARGRPDGSLRVAHDGTRLCLAVTGHEADARPRRGRGDYGAGDWLEVGITADGRSTRLGIGLDPRGRVVWEPVGSARLPEGLEGQVGGEPAARQRLYELAVPLKSLVGSGDPRQLREIGLSVAVWDEEPRGGIARTYTWGSALLGRSLIPFRHERVRLHRSTHAAYQAGLALARELPYLPRAWALFRDACRTHADTPSVLKALHREFLSRHRDGPVAVRALVSLDQFLRTGPGADPSREVLELAARAGVSDAARRRYQQLTGVCLSQWVHIDPKTPPVSFLLQLDASPRSGGAEHRVYWGRDGWREGTPGRASRRNGGALPPAGSWQELRVPLLWLDMHRQPIHGIAFYQRGGANLLWDRTAVVRPGREHVFIDDKLPKGKPYGNWRWVGHLHRSGSRAHGESQHLRDSSTSRRALFYMEPPVVEHMLPEPFGPYLSQWVYIEQPTKMLSIGLHDGSDWRRFCWGEPHRESRTIGPLPRAGSWQELRVPLDGLLGCPVRGVLFGRDAGRVYWDRTAVVVGGRERIVLDDEVPEGHCDASDWQWVDKPVRSGKRAHTLKRPSGSYRSHDVYRFAEPILDHMPLKPGPAAAILRRYILQLGPTSVAWRFFEDLLRLSPSDAKARIEQYTWFLRHFPDHPMGVTVLTRLLAHHREAQSPDPLAAVEAVIAASKLPAKTCYDYRRRYAHPADCYIRTWLLLGPFPNADDKGFDTAFPPEGEAVDLRKAYTGTRGPVRWRRHTAPENAVRLHLLLEPSEDVVAYAVCWVHSPRSRAASLELGSDDGCKVWVNRKAVFALHEERAATPRQNIVPIHLRRGANELLLKIEQGKADWEFYVELVGADGRSLLDDVTVTTAPPGGR